MLLSATALLSRLRALPRHSGPVLRVQAGLFLIGLVSSLCTARWLGVTDRGYLGTLQSLVVIALQLANLGGPAAVLHFAAKDGKTTGSLALGSLVLTLVVGSVVSLAMLAVPASWLGAVPFGWQLVALAFMPAYLLQWLWRQLLIGVDGAVSVARSDWLTRLTIFLLLIGLQLMGHLSVPNLLLGSGVITAVQAAVCGLWLRSRSGEWRWQPALYRLCWRYALLSYVSGMLGALLLRLDGLLLAAWQGPFEMGLYSVAKQLLDILLVLPVALGPLLAVQVAKEPGSLPVTLSTCRVLSGGLVGFLALVAVTAPWGVPWLLGAPYAAVVPALWALLPGIWAYILGNVVLQHFAGRGNPSLVIWAPALGLVVNGLASWFWIPVYGAVGTAAAASLGYLVQLALCLQGLKRFEGIRARTVLGLGAMPLGD